MLAAFDADPGLSPSSLIEDDRLTRHVDGVEWSPENYDGEYAGEIPLRDAIARSRNIPAVLLAERVGLNALDTWLAKLGLTGAEPLPSMALGAFDASPLDLAQAYTVFASGGEVATAQLLAGVRGAEGETLWSEESRTVRVASERAAALATSVLESVIQEGTGRSAAEYGLAGPVAGKTGTTDETRDAWFAGFTPELAVVVWVGHDQGQPLELSGARAALPAWSRFVTATGTAHGAFPQPARGSGAAGDLSRRMGRRRVQRMWPGALQPRPGASPGLRGAKPLWLDLGAHWWGDPPGDPRRPGTATLRRRRHDSSHHPVETPAPPPVVAPSECQGLDRAAPATGLRAHSPLAAMSRHSPVATSMDQTSATKSGTSSETGSPPTR